MFYVDSLVDPEPQNGEAQRPQSLLTIDTNQPQSQSKNFFENIISKTKRILCTILYQRM